MDWKIKSIPEDFIVDEVIIDKVKESWNDKLKLIRGKQRNKKTSKYVWFRLKKTNLDFFKTIEKISKELKIGTKSIAYAGTKDKSAVTSQTISVPIECMKDLQNLGIKGIAVDELRIRNRQVRLGEHDGNNFKLIVRNIKNSEKKKTESIIEGIKKYGFVNFFGIQRFGSVKEDNHKIGKCIIKGEFENAVKKITEMKLLKKRDGFSGEIDFEYVLTRVPLRLVKLFTHSFQSYLWNECAFEYLKEVKTKNQVVIPLIGYKTDLEKYPETSVIIKKKLKHENVSVSDFKVSEFPKLSSRGFERDLFAIPKNMKYEFFKDDMNNGKMALRLDFFLGKGSYATELVRQLGGGK